MALVQTNVGDIKSLALIRTAWNGASQPICHLFQNNYTPLQTSVAGNFTAPTYEGYAAIGTTGWTAAHAVGQKAQTEADPLIFVHAPGATSNTIYGYWMEPANDLGTVWFAERFASPAVLAADGDTLVVFPRYTQDTE